MRQSGNIPKLFCHKKHNKIIKFTETISMPFSLEGFLTEKNVEKNKLVALKGKSVAKKTQPQDDSTA